jgi:hypothetical protein
MPARVLLILFAAVLTGLALVSASSAADLDSLYFAVHPRLAFTRADVPSLRLKIHDGGADDAAYATLRGYVLGDYRDSTFAALLNISYGMDIAQNCGLVSFLDDPPNADAMDEGRRFTIALADSFGAGDDPFYTSIRLRALCYGYDTCMQNATPAERAYVRGEIESYVDSLMNAFNIERWLHPPYTSNKTAMTGAALGIAAICLADEMDPARVAAALARADTFVDTWIRYHLDPDGSCFEGVQYGAWAMRHLAWYFEARRRYDGVDYSRRDDMRRIERWLAYETLPERGGVVNNLNDTAYLNHPLSRINTYLEWAIANWHSGVASWLWDRMLGPDDGYDWGMLEDHAATVLWNRRVTPVNPGDTLPGSMLWKERGLYYYRTGWPSHGDSDDTVFSFYSGVFHGGHAQEDQGSFTLYAYGSRFAADNGFDAPNGKSEAHNLVFVDGKGQHFAGSSVGTDGRMRAHMLTPYADYLFGDMTAAYTTYSPYNAPGVPFPDDDWSYGYFGDNPVDHAHREWLVVKKGETPPYFLLLDDVKKDDATRAYQWRMHSDADNPIDLAANPIRIGGKRGTLALDVVHPDFGTLERTTQAFDNASVDPNTNVIELTQTSPRGLFAIILRPSGPSDPPPAVSTATYGWGGTEVLHWPGDVTDVLLVHDGADTVAASAHLSDGHDLAIRTDARILQLRRHTGSPDRTVFVRATTCDAGGIPLLRVKDGPATVVIAGTRAYVSRHDAKLRVYAPDVRTLQAGDTLLTFARDGDFIERTDRHSPASAPRLRVFPMPATRSSTVEVNNATAGVVTVDVFDVAGRRVRSLWNGPLPQGRTLLTFDGRDDLAQPLSSGVYFARARQEGRTTSAKIVWVH